MKGKNCRILVSVLLLGLALSAGIAWAGVTLIPITGSQESAYHEDNDPGKVWMDENGIRHIRGKTHYSIASGTDDEGNIRTAEGWVTTNVNMITYPDMRTRWVIQNIVFLLSHLANCFWVTKCMARNQNSLR